jgi:calnexin
MIVDKLTHLYSLIVRPDNTFEILIDGESVKQGSLLSDFEPPVNPPDMVPDPNDVKPSDWVDAEKIPDPSVHKPLDWDDLEPEYVPDPDRLDPPEGWLLEEPKMIPDPKDKRPTEWNEAAFGEWAPKQIPNPACESAVGCGEYEPPLIKNPDYKGKWKAPKITNPAYRGPWKPRLIANPNYFEDAHPSHFEPIHGVGFELWMIETQVGFNNVYLGTDEAAMRSWNKQHFVPKFKSQVEDRKAAAKREATESGEDVDDDRLGLVEILEKTASAVQEIWADLFAENPAATLIGTLLIALLPVLIGACYCCAMRNEESESSDHYRSSRRHRMSERRRHRRRRRDYSDEEDRTVRRRRSSRKRSRRERDEDREEEESKENVVPKKSANSDSPRKRSLKKSPRTLSDED